MGVSKNRGTPKSSILIGLSFINHPFWGTHIFGNTHINKKTQPLPLIRDWFVIRFLLVRLAVESFLGAKGFFHRGLKGVRAEEVPNKKKPDGKKKNRSKQDRLKFGASKTQWFSIIRYSLIDIATKIQRFRYRYIICLEYEGLTHFLSLDRCSARDT